MFAAESAKARRLKDELAECKSEHANLEAMATEANRIHVGTLFHRSAHGIGDHWDNLH